MFARREEELLKAPPPQVEPETSKEPQATEEAAHSEEDHSEEEHEAEGQENTEGDGLHLPKSKPSKDTVF